MDIKLVRYIIIQNYIVTEGQYKYAPFKDVYDEPMNQYGIMQLSIRKRNKYYYQLNRRFYSIIQVCQCMEYEKKLNFY